MPVVNVNDDGDTVAWPVVPDVTSITTLPDGSESSTTVNVAVLLPPAASVTVTDDVDFVNPAVSLSVRAAATVWSDNAS